MQSDFRQGTNWYNSLVLWTSPITFDKPALLALAPLGLFIVWVIFLRSRAELNDVSRKQVFILRSVIVCLVVLSIAGITWQRLTDRITTIFVVDVSDSVPMSARQSTLQFIKRSLNNQHAGDRVGLVVFGREPFVEFPPAQTVDVTQVRAQAPGDATDIQSALEAAAGAMPTDTGKRIVLMTDGLENLGSAESTVASLKEQGVQVDIAPTMLEGSKAPEALVERIVTPSHWSVNSPLRMRVVLSSNVNQAASLTISRDGKPIDHAQMQLGTGKSAYFFDDRVHTAGLHKYTAELEPTMDTQPQNNSMSSVVMIEGSPRILFVRDANEPLSSALPNALSVQGLNVTQASPSSLPTTASGLAGYDSIILSDVAASDLSADQMNGLKLANQSFGVGLGMIGGVNSFGAGGYAGSPIEDVLPVTMTPKDKKRVPAADVVIVLDASGSMSAEEGGVEKVEIAARAALNLLGALQPKDRVAVLAVTETATIVMPLSSPSGASKYVPAIESVEAGGGGIDCRNGLVAAYTILQTSDAQIKHVIICPDTTDSEQKEGCVALATAEYDSSKISTSVCGIGEWTDPDVPFQKDLAAAGHGQLFVANQAGSLPQFFQRDVKNVEQKLIAEGNFAVGQTPGDPVTEGDLNLPNILGYNLVSAKTGATTPMTLTEHDDPLVAYWRHGIGKSFAYTSDDDSHWARNWVKSSTYPAFWAHLVRWSLKSGEDPSFQTLATDIKGSGHIVVDAFNQSGYLTGSHFVAEVAGPEGAVSQVKLAETSPGRYEGSFDASAVGGYLLQVQNTDTGGHQTNSVTTSYPPEYANLAPDTRLLGDIASETGGIFLNSPAESFRRGELKKFGSESLVNSLLLFACLLFVLDVAWRRFGWRFGRSTANIAGERLRTGAIVAAGSIKRSIRRPAVNIIDRTPNAKAVNTADVDLLKSRTASRADLDDDDDPFPYVATLPPRSGKDKMLGSTKENK